LGIDDDDDDDDDDGNGVDDDDDGLVLVQCLGQDVHKFFKINNNNKLPSKICIKFHTFEKLALTLLY
jgi:hypothetical protein